MNAIARKPKLPGPTQGVNFCKRLEYWNLSEYSRDLAASVRNDVLFFNVFAPNDCPNPRDPGEGVQFAGPLRLWIDG